MLSVKAQIAGAASLAAAVALVSLPAAHAADSTTVNIKLEDSTTNSSIQDMKIVLDRHVVHAGKVTLRATNDSKQLVHEVLVLPDTGAALPYNASSGRLIESEMKSLGEVDDLKPGKSGQHTFDLKPGNYLLVCNQAMHFKDGMFARLKVVPASATITSAENTQEAKDMTPPDTKDVTLPANASASDADGS